MTQGNHSEPQQISKQNAKTQCAVSIYIKIKLWSEKYLISLIIDIDDIFLMSLSILECTSVFS